MIAPVDLEERIQHSRRMLREWAWMTTISTRPDDALAVLSQEARNLVELGLEHPSQAKRIGPLIVFYQRLIDRMKARIAGESS